MGKKKNKDGDFVNIIRRILLMAISIIIVSSFSFADENVFYIHNGVLKDFEEPVGESDDVKKISILGDGYSKLTNYADGYVVDIPSDMVIDVSMSPVRTVLANEKTQIEIYYDNFKGTVHSGNSYTKYSNQKIYNSAWHNITTNKTISVNGLNTKLLAWNRKKLLHIEGDMNYILSAEIHKGWSEVYTILIKSEEPIVNYNRIVNSLKTIENKGEATFKRKLAKKNRFMNPELESFYKDYFGKDSKQRWGVFHPPSPKDMDALNSLEEKLDHEFDVLVRYHTFDTTVPLEELEAAYAEEKYLELTLQTMSFSQPNINDSVLYRILDGEFDYLLRKYAKDLKSFKHPVLFRLNNEMNGDWCVYSAIHNGKDTEVYKESWKYIHKIFKEEGADNILWVWNPHDLSFPDFKWNHYLNYFPGEEYVDIVGLTGYNTGTYYKGEKWRNFDEIYPEIYEEYLSLFEYPLMITEFGTNHVGGDKIAWINDMFSKMGDYDRIKVVIWFNGTDLDSKGKAAREYRLDNTEEVIEAFRTNFNKISTNENLELEAKVEIEEILENPIVEQ